MGTADDITGNCNFKMLSGQCITPEISPGNMWLSLGSIIK